VAHYGYTRDEFMAMTIRDIRPPEDLPRLQANLDANRPGRDQAGVWRHCTKDGRTLLVEITSHRIDFEGRDAELVMALDVSDRERNRQQMEDAETRKMTQRDALVALLNAASRGHADLAASLRELLEVAAHAAAVERASIWRFKGDRSGIACVDLFESRAGVHQGGALLEAAAFPAYFAAVEESNLIVADDALADPRTQEFGDAYLRPLGIGAMLDAPVRVGDALDGVICLEHVGGPRAWSSDDQTFALALANLAALAIERHERGRAEAQLRLHDAALNAAASAFVIADPDGAILWVNPAFTRLTQYTLEEAVGKNPRELLRSGQHDAAFYADLWETVLRGDTWQGQLINRRKDGSLYHEEQTIAPVRDVAGRITHFVSVKQDISARLETERALRDSQRRLQQAVSAGGIGLWEWNLLDDSVAYSDEWCAQVGCTRDELTGTVEDALLRLHPDDAERARRAFADPVTFFEPSATLECRLRHADGAYRWMVCTASLYRDAEGVPRRVLGTNVDITDVKRLQEEFQQAQKMESVGRLAGGVAHDFNNLLSIIGGYAEIVMEHLRDDEVLRRDVEQIKRASDRAASLTRQLLAFSRRQVLQPVVVNVNQVITDAEKMLRRMIGEDIAIEVRLAPDLGPVLADPGQIEQVLMNLAVNARDAMPTGGNLLLETAETEVEPGGTVGAGGLPPGRYVRIRVRDSGAGMDAHTLEHLFDPFFTTKEQGKGTGLGLAVVYGVVKQSGGEVRVESSPGEGSTFDVYIPVHTGQESSPAARTASDGPLHGDETILVVEDEEVLRKLAQRVLSAAGYSVIAAASGNEARAMLDAHPGPVSLLLTDVVMPEMGGRAIAESLLETNPGIKVLYMSGYTDDVLSRHGVLEEGLHLLNKPFTPVRLLRSVREVLDGV
jgi:PAS domain S-box-containing protein